MAKKENQTGKFLKRALPLYLSALPPKLLISVVDKITYAVKTTDTKDLPAEIDRIFREAVIELDKEMMLEIEKSKRNQECAEINRIFKEAVIEEDKKQRQKRAKETKKNSLERR